MKKLMSVVLVGAFLSGCSSIPLDPTAARIIATPHKAPKGCRYIGQVLGNQGNFFTGGFTSNRNLEEGAMNDMRNQAAKMGANYIQILNSRAGNTGSFSGHGGGMEQTNVTNLGNAYYCSPVVLGE